MLSAGSKLTVNLIGGDSEEYQLIDISKLIILDNTVKVQSVEINTESQEIEIGDTYQINYSITPNNASNQSVTWSSSNNNVATVDGNGLVTAVAEGEAIITVETEDANYTDTIKIIVSPTSSVKDYKIDVQLYPNPVQNSLHIDIKNISNYEVIISDVSGNILYSQFDKNEIDFSSFSAGNYFLTLIINNQYYNYKLIKN